MKVLALFFVLASLGSTAAFAGGVDMNCMRDCGNRGYLYQYCQSACSYGVGSTLGSTINNSISETNRMKDQIGERSANFMSDLTKQRLEQEQLEEQRLRNEQLRLQIEEQRRRQGQ